MKAKVYALFRRFEGFSYEDEYGIRSSDAKFLGLYGSENAVMKEIEDRVMADYYEACDCFDDYIELELEYGINSDRVFDFQILEQTDDRIKYSWCGDHITLYWKIFEVDVEPEPEKPKINKERIRKHRELLSSYKEKIMAGHDILQAWKEVIAANGPKISDSDGSVR